MDLPDAPKPGGIHHARSALAQARQVRAQALAGLAVGRWAPEDVFDMATTRAEHPLRRLRLTQMLYAVPGIGPRTVTRILHTVAEVAGEPDKPLREMTVSWLLDRRSGGKRYLAWIDTVTARREAPWAGFPCAPNPGGRRARGAD